MNEFIRCLSLLPGEAKDALVIALEFFAAFERNARANASTQSTASTLTKDETIDYSLFDQA